MGKDISFICDDCGKERKGVLPFLLKGDKKICPRCIQKDESDGAKKYPEEWHGFLKRNWDGFHEEHSEGYHSLWLREKSGLEELLKMDRGKKIAEQMTQGKKKEVLSRIRILERRISEYRGLLAIRSKQTFMAMTGHETAEGLVVAGKHWWVRS